MDWPTYGRSGLCSIAMLPPHATHTLPEERESGQAETSVSSALASDSIVLYNLLLPMVYLTGEHTDQERVGTAHARERRPLWAHCLTANAAYWNVLPMGWCCVPRAISSNWNGAGICKQAHMCPKSC